jgi:hypothetical protein
MWPFAAAQIHTSFHAGDDERDHAFALRGREGGAVGIHVAESRTGAQAPVAEVASGADAAQARHVRSLEACR